MVDVLMVGVLAVEAAVEVTAPSDLPEGFVFDAVANGQTFSVTVPAGGVSRGQTAETLGDPYMQRRPLPRLT